MSKRILDILIVLSILFVGSDVLSFNIFGVTIRYVQLFYVLVTIYLLFMRRYYLKLTKPIIAILIAFILSTIASINVFTSIKYYFWFIYNIVFVLSLFYSYYIISGSQKILSLFKTSIVIIFILCCFQFAIDGVLKIQLPIFSSQHDQGSTRLSLWFYEPSYFATYLTIFLAIFIYDAVIFGNKKSFLYLAITALCVLLTTSTTGYISIIISILAINILLLVSKTITLRNKLIVIGSEFVLVILLFACIGILFKDTFMLYFMRLFDKGLVYSSGTRISAYNEQIDVFKKFWSVGCGLGAYGVYFDNPEYQATNVSLELLATTGIVGFLTFYIAIISPLYEVFFSKRKHLYKYSKMFSFSLICFIIILQANQNFLRLYLWMLYGILLASITLERKRIEIKER